jgi:PAS domain S-box-containing protein
MIERDSGHLPIERRGGLDKRFCEVMDAAPVMIWVSGKDKGCIWFNQPWLTFTGRSIAQEVGNGWTDGIHREDFDRCLEMYFTHFEARKDFRMQYRLRRSDGAYRWIDDAGIPRYARDGTFLGYIGSCTDVTHLKEAEEARRESEHRLRLALDAAQMGTFEADIAANRALVDAQAARLLNLPDDTRILAVDELRRRMPLEDLTASSVKRERMTRYHEPYQHEFRLRLPDGSDRWLSMHAAVRSNRIFGVGFDVTDRKLVESALRESEARLRIATSAAGLGVFEWDPGADRAVWENERMYEIFQRTRADGPLTKRQFVGDHLYQDDAQYFETVLEEARRTGEPFHVVVRIRSKDGAQRWLRIDGKYLTSVTDGSVRLLAVIADITSGKQLEHRAVRASQRLATIQEEERRNIARELHDSTVQHLVAASLTLMTLKSSVGGERTDLWNDIERCLDEAMKELRTFCYLLHPPALRAGTLRSTLEEYVAGLASRSGLNIRLRLNPQVERLSLPVMRSLFRVVQAGLANVYRHAQATAVSVQLRWIGAGLHLTITDNGRGLDGGAPFMPGIGLRGIRARMDELGGKFRVIQAKPRGTVVHVVIPVDNEGRAAAPGAAPSLGLTCDDGLACSRSRS